MEPMVPPVEQSCDSPTAAAACGDANKTLPTPFLTKTYQLVDDPSVDDVISWNDDGSAFVVWRPAEFARDVLPKYFKHNNFSSFVRQLNTYGFRKIVPDRWEFANDCFRKGEKRMLCGIHRRKALLQANLPANVSASSASSGEEPFPSTSNGAEMAAAVACTWSGATATELLEENEKLRKENFHLRQEINQMKGLCNNIFALMTKYAKRTENGLASTTVGRPTVISPEAPADRREVKTEAEEEEEEEQEEEVVRGHSVEREEEARSAEASPRLFGVSIRTSKRVREETNRNDGMKSESLDPASLSLWLRYRFQGSQSDHLKIGSGD
ncbi:heat stress transcription factor B-2b-like [Nymphaea colorata]|nr:heat stress transcription factor B-2b-like [Nymphaea colorata]